MGGGVGGCGWGGCNDWALKKDDVQTVGISGV